MEYTATEFIEATGVPLRTIRLWTERKLVPPPLGKGPGTRYTEDHRILVRVIAELRTEVHQLKVIKKRIAKLSRDELLQIIGEAPATPPEAPNDTSPPARVPTPPDARPHPGTAGLPLPPANDSAPPPDASRGPLDAHGRDAPFPEGARWVIVGLLPHLALMVGEGASPLVRRIAAEICREYRHE